MAGRTGATPGRMARSAALVEIASVTDRELLRRFADTGDEHAFTTLVARHAPMVHGVCQRVLPTVQDAEDACQATFWILARKARAGQWQPSVANWLYTTARQVASKAQRTAVRRARRERRAAIPETIPELEDISGRELLAALDEELGKLPTLYREPLVLCYLEGLSREDVATHLGIPAGTVKTRLERGRKRIEAALIRRGIMPGLGVLALAITTPARATPLKQIESILAVVSGPPPAAVAALVRGAVMSGLLRKGLIAVVVAISIAGLGIGWDAVSPAATEPGSGQPTEQHPGSSDSTVPRSQNHPTPHTAVPARSGRPTLPLAPVPKDLDAQFLKDVAGARARAIGFLRTQQTPDGTWESGTLKYLADMDGGSTALVVLAMLEAGVPTNDPAVAKAVEYLVKLPPRKTYVVSLQTQALAKADPKKHANLIQKNVDWLIDKAIGLKAGSLDGWSYPGGQIGDGSNTHFAVMALHAAARAGAKVDDSVWVAIRDHYVRNQKNGGWTYQNVNFDTSISGSMTVAALAGLAVAAKHEKTPNAGKEAFEKGMTKLLEMPDPGTKCTGYLWMTLAELGRASETTTFKSKGKELAWYREGATKRVADQQPDGSWVGGVGIDSMKVMSTAFGLYFLGPPANK